MAAAPLHTMDRGVTLLDIVRETSGRRFLSLPPGYPVESISSTSDKVLDLQDEHQVAIVAPELLQVAEGITVLSSTLAPAETSSGLYTEISSDIILGVRDDTASTTSDASSASKTSLDDILRDRDLTMAWDTKAVLKVFEKVVNSLLRLLEANSHFRFFVASNVQITTTDGRESVVDLVVLFLDLVKLEYSGMVFKIAAYKKVKARDMQRILRHR